MVNTFTKAQLQIVQFARCTHEGQRGNICCGPQRRHPRITPAGGVTTSGEFSFLFKDTIDTSADESERHVSYNWLRHSCRSCLTGQERSGGGRRGDGGDSALFYMTPWMKLGQPYCSRVRVFSFVFHYWNTEKHKDLWTCHTRNVDELRKTKEWQGRGLWGVKYFPNRPMWYVPSVLSARPIDDTNSRNLYLELKKRENHISHCFIFTLTNLHNVDNVTQRAASLDKALSTRVQRNDAFLNIH